MKISSKSRRRNRFFHLFPMVVILFMPGVIPDSLAAQDQEEGPRPEELVRILSDKAQNKIKEKYGDQFRVYETDHFTVMSDTSPRFHRVIAGNLEIFYQEMHSRFFHVKMKPVQVFLISGGKDYERFMYDHVDRADGSDHGVYMKDRRTIFARRYFKDGSNSGIGTLYHLAIYPMMDAEYVKAPPRWFEVGLATLVERGRVIKGKWVFGNPNPWRESEFCPAFEKGEVPDLKTLLTLSDEEFSMGPAMYMNMHSTRSFFLYLLRSGEDRFAKFLDLTRRGKKGPLALKAATGMKVEEVEEEWKQSILTVNFAGCFAYNHNRKSDLQILEEGVAKYPDYGFLRSVVADAWTDARKNTQAIIHAKAALEDPRFLFPHQAYWTLGIGYRFGKATKAIEAYRAAISYQPWVENILESCHRNLIDLLLKKKDEEGAAEIGDQLEALLAEDSR